MAACLAAFAFVADMSSTPAKPIARHTLRSRVNRSPSKTDASTAVITGMSR
ncbi:MAG: hypothetical protein ACKOWG_04190 [Planctomycetia bacterium]